MKFRKLLWVVFSDCERLYDLMNFRVLALVAIAVTVFTAPNGYARVGETRAECIKRYGVVVEREVDPVIGEMLTFQKGDIVVSAMISDGKCIGMMYSKERPYTVDELLQKYGILELNEVPAEKKIKRMAFTKAERFKLFEVNGDGKEWGGMTEEAMATFLPKHLAKAIANNPEALKELNIKNFYRKGDGLGYLARLDTATNLDGLIGEEAVSDIIIIRSDLAAAFFGDGDTLKGF